MKKMHLLKFALLLGVSAVCEASISFGAVTYSQLGTTGLAVSTATLPAVLEDVNLAASATGLQQLTAMTFGYGVLAGTTAQTAAVFVDFYDTYTPTAASGSVVSNYIGGFGGTLNVTANITTTTAARSSSFSNLGSLTTPINFSDPNFAVVVTFASADGSTYSTILTPLTSTNTPTIGTSTPGVYRDTNGDGIFQATELNATGGNYYLSITTVSIVPEPSTYALAGISALAVGIALVRRNRRQAA